MKIIHYALLVTSVAASKAVKRFMREASSLQDRRSVKKMDCSLAFNHSPSGSFVVLLEFPSVHDSSSNSVSMTEFTDENEFIQNVVLGVSSNEAIMSIIAHILLDISGRQPAAKWLPIDLPAAELTAIGLKLVE